MKNKKSFVFYHDQLAAIKDLPADLFQKLVIAVGDYSETGVKPDLDSVMSALFIMFKNTIDRDADKYDKICKRNRENGLKKKKKKNPVGASGLSGNPKQPKKADSDSEKDSDSEREKNVFVAPTIPDVISKISEFCEKKNLIMSKQQVGIMAEDFVEHYENCDWRLNSGKGRKMKDWCLSIQKWLRTDYKAGKIEQRLT